MMTQVSRYVRRLLLAAVLVGLLTGAALADGVVPIVDSPRAGTTP